MWYSQEIVYYEYWEKITRTNKKKLKFVDYYDAQENGRGKRIKKKCCDQKNRYIAFFT